MRSFESCRVAPLSLEASARHLPSLPSLPETPTVRVKNTFIQSVVLTQADDSDEELLPPMLASRSCPVSCNWEDPWKPSGACVEALEEHSLDESARSEDERNPEMPMTVMRTWSDFSNFPAEQILDCSPASVSVDYSFDCSPTVIPGVFHGSGAFHVQNSDGLGNASISGIGSTFLNRVHGVSVKNTFIDDYFDGDKADALASVVSIHSCPPPNKATSPLAQEVVPELGAVSFEDFAAFRMRAARRQAPFAPGVNVQQPSKPPGIFVEKEVSYGRTRTVSSESDPPRQTSSESEAVSEASPEFLAEGVTPLESRQPEKSAGSVSHGSGECKPCAWFWRMQGCLNGEACRHCHLCPQGAMKVRRKVKKAQSNLDTASAAA